MREAFLLVCREIGVGYCEGDGVTRRGVDNCHISLKANIKESLDRLDTSVDKLGEKKYLDTVLNFYKSIKNYNRSAIAIVDAVNYLNIKSNLFFFNNITCLTNKLAYKQVF